MRTVIHASVLALANLAGLVLGFVAFALASTPDQLAVQLPIAVIVSLVGFAAWVGLVNGRGPARLRFRGRRDAAGSYALAPVVAAVVFVPLHLVTTGYLTAFSNLLALGAFQLLANLPAVAIASARSRPPDPELP